KNLYDLHKVVIKNQELLASNTAYMNHAMKDYHIMLTGSLESLRIEDIREALQNALGNCTRQDISPEKFEEHIGILYRKAITRAKEAHLTGGSIDIMNRMAMQTALQQPVQKN